MAISIGRATGTLFSPSFFRMVALVVAGAAISTYATNFLKENVYDVNVPGGDAVYALLTVFVIRTVLSGRSSMVMSAGAGMGAFVAVGDELGVF